MDFDNIIGYFLVYLLFFGGSLGSAVFGLEIMGVIKRKELNKSKWIKTTAIVVGNKNVAEKTIGRGPKFIYYKESAILYNVNGKKYKKFVKNLPENIHRVCILYKRKNPNYFKLAYELKYRENISIPSGIFLCFLSICLFISGCLIVSAVL